VNNLLPLLVRERVEVARRKAWTHLRTALEDSQREEGEERIMSSDLLDHIMYVLLPTYLFTFAHFRLLISSICFAFALRCVAIKVTHSCGRKLFSSVLQNE